MSSLWGLQARRAEYPRREQSYYICDPEFITPILHRNLMPSRQIVSLRNAKRLSYFLSAPKEFQIFHFSRQRDVYSQASIFYFVNKNDSSLRGDPNTIFGRVLGEFGSQYGAKKAR